MLRRSRAREVVLQLLYQDDLNPERELAPDVDFMNQRLHRERRTNRICSDASERSSQKSRRTERGSGATRSQLVAGANGGHRP